MKDSIDRYFYIQTDINASTYKIISDSLSDVMSCKLSKHATVIEFDSHWIFYTFCLVPD